MATYGIKDLEKLTGIKAHTLRIWEKRYNVIEPERTNTNIRTYTDDELKKILNVSILNKNGFKISKIVKMTDEEIVQKLFENSEVVNNDINLYHDELLLHMINMDESSFYTTLNRCIDGKGFEVAYSEVVIPFLEKIGVLWQVGSVNPAQEHFVSNLIRQKLIVAIDQFPYPDKKKNIDVLLFLPENELHELGLLFSHYLVKSAGYSSVYLGQGVPYNDLIKTVMSTKPKFIVTYFVNAIPESEIKNILFSLEKEYPQGTLIAMGNQSVDYKNVLPEKVYVLDNSTDLKKVLRK